jgi:anhydro-N-acetylmuramic acid kinase
MAARLLQDGRDRGLGDPDIVATITALTARSIAQAYRDFAPAPIEEVILGGGGARNPALVAMLRQALAPVPVRTHEDLGLDGDLKEALVFALLAHETWHDRPGVLPALTGAEHATVLGQITPGANFRHLIEHTWRHT